MLKTELNFEVQDLFAVADKAKMPRFDDARVDGPYADFVQFFTANLEKRVVGNAGLWVGPVERKAHGFEPGVIGVGDTKVFMNFPFKFVKRRTKCRERWQYPVFMHQCRGNKYRPGRIVGDAADQLHLATPRKTVVIHAMAAFLTQQGRVLG